MTLIKFLVIISLVYESLGLNSVANAGTWMCFTPECNIGNVTTKEQPRDNDKWNRTSRPHKTTTIRRGSAGTTIIDEDYTNGTTTIRESDGERTRTTIIDTDEE
jgi:hypothetical protein